MRHTKKSMTAAKAHDHWFELLDAVQESHEPAQITYKTKSFFLVDAASWSSIMETFYLNSMPNVKASLEKEFKEPMNKGSKTLKW